MRRFKEAVIVALGVDQHQLGAVINRVVIISKEPACRQHLTGWSAQDKVGITGNTDKVFVKVGHVIGHFLYCIALGVERNHHYL